MSSHVATGRSMKIADGFTTSSGGRARRGGLAPMRALCRGAAGVVGDQRDLSAVAQLVESVDDDFLSGLHAILHRYELPAGGSEAQFAQADPVVGIDHID